MIDDLLADAAPARPVWMITLADLALLLVGFFVLLQANQQLDPRELARGLAAGFGVEDAPMPVDAQSVGGFAAGRATPAPLAPSVVAWARAATRDPRVTLTITGSADASPADVDPATGSAMLLAADRARAVAAALVAAGVPGARLRLATAPAAGPSATGHRLVIITLAFAGEEGKHP
jgi:flagellar motor protein MotB